MERFRERDAEVVANLATFAPSAPIAQELAQLRLRSSQGTCAAVHDRVRSAQRRLPPSDQVDVHERPRVARSAYAAAASEALRHVPPMTRTRVAGQVFDAEEKRTVRGLLRPVPHAGQR